MTVSALTRPGERDRLVNKVGEIDWIFCLTLCLIAGDGATMLFSIAGSSWMPGAAPLPPTPTDTSDTGGVPEAPTQIDPNAPAGTAPTPVQPIAQPATPVTPP